MLDESQLTQLKNLADAAQSHLVLFEPKAKPSIVAAASAWYLALKEKGADVRLAAVKKPKIKGLVGLEATETDLGKQNLTISFDYDENAVDKISYHIGEETKKFYLTIKPKKGHPPLDAKTVKFAYTGFEADIIYLFGINNLEDLDKLYFGYEEKFKEIPIVSFHTQPTSLGIINITADRPALTEDVFRLLARLVWPISPDTATDLLFGIEAETDGLRSPLATAETFDAVARLMKLGARRVWEQTSTKNNGHQTKAKKLKKTSPKTGELEVKPS